MLKTAKCEECGLALLQKTPLASLLTCLFCTYLYNAAVVREQSALPSVLLRSYDVCCISGLIAIIHVLTSYVLSPLVDGANGTVIQYKRYWWLHYGGG